MSALHSADIRQTCEKQPLTEPQSQDGFIPPDTRIRYDGLDKGGPEYGVVVHCWNDDEIDGHDCYVAFFGSTIPSGKPYILRYAATSLNLIDP